MHRLILIAAFLWAAAAPVHADFDAGLEAAHKGDFATARAEWQALVDDGDARAQYYLGMLNAEGRGAEPDFVEAGRLFGLSAAQGYVDAQFAVAIMHDRGQGLAQDDVLATRWYRTAAEAGHVDAQYNLAIAYMRGNGVEVDEAEGVKWFHAAGEQGHSHALVNLGVVHAIGKGVARDPVAAYMWFRIATKKDVRGADQALDRTRGELSEEQIAAAEAGATAWLENHP